MRNFSYVQGIEQQDRRRKQRFKVRSAQGDKQAERADKVSDEKLEAVQTGDEVRTGGACRQGDGGRQA